VQGGLSLDILKTANFWTFACNLNRDFKSKAPNRLAVNHKLGKMKLKIRVSAFVNQEYSLLV
jgi:hypothetical protein